MEIRIEELRTLKPGRYVMIDDVACKITKITHSKPGKHGGAKAKVDAVGVFDGQKRNIMKPTSDKVQVPMIEKKSAQVLNVMGNQIQLMDLTTYETFEISMPDDPELKGADEQGTEVIYMEFSGQKKIFQVKGK